MRPLFPALAVLALAPTPSAAQAPPVPPPPVVRTETLPNTLPDAAERAAAAAAAARDPRKPRLTNVYELFTADNYPALARDREVEGRVKVRVKVGPSGLATHCETLGTPPPELGGPTCALILAEGRFEPARDRRT